MKIGLSSVAYNPGGWTLKQLDSILPHTKHEVLTNLFLHSNKYESLIDECNIVNQKYNINYLAYGKNRGLNKSFNESLYRFFEIEQCDIVVGLSQDIFFNNISSFDNWINNIYPYIDSKYLIGHIPAIQTNFDRHSAPFCIIVITKKGFETIGYGDENFFPAQYEDLDLHIRMSLAINEDPNNFWHPNYRIDVEGDTTHFCMLVRTDKELNYQQEYITGPRCREYYIKKWGNVEKSQCFLHPFNDKNIDYYIPYSKCHNPYGKYDRTDKNIILI